MAEQPFFNPLPQGMVSGDALTDEQRALLARGGPAGPAAAPAPPPDPAAQPAPVVDPGAAPAEGPVHRCKYCGWSADGRPPDWLKPEDYAGLVDQLMAEGRFAHTFRLGTALAVTFRTLTADEEGVVHLAGALAPTATNPVAVLTEVQRAAGEYEFLLAVAAVEQGGRQVYRAPDVPPPADELTKLLAPLAGLFRAGPVKSAVRRAYHQFYAGVRVAVEKGLAPNS